MSEDTPINDNQSFAALLRNPHRDRAEIVLQAFIGGMKEEGVPRATIIRALFDYVVHELGDVPQDGKVSDAVLEAENTAIIFEIDAYWMNIRRRLEEEAPGTLTAYP